MIKEIAYAKVNLFLNVSAKRKDGYHDLEMLNVKIDLFDELTFKEIDTKDMVIIKSNDLFLSNQENIVIQVARYLLKTYDIKSGVEIEIDKKIPFGAGLAGNSADSAAVIKGINKLFKLNLSLDEMKDIALMFGADIPYCLSNKPAIVTGIGEKIEEVELNLSDYKILLINPCEYIGTKEVFQLVEESNIRTKDIDLIRTIIKDKDSNLLIQNLFNSLEEIVVSNYEIMKEFKDILSSKLGNNGLVMTGSGSSFVKVLHKNNDVSQFIKEYQGKYLIKIHNFL
ncbi:MAG: 4-(cytidine 5'-diphospho)-2-C-methyl-D-erythritol kinase [Candidatus Izemoplasmatales bacterium]